VDGVADHVRKRLLALVSLGHLTLVVLPWQIFELRQVESVAVLDFRHITLPVPEIDFNEVVGAIPPVTFPEDAADAARTNWASILGVACHHKLRAVRAEHMAVTFSPQTPDHPRLVKL